MASRRDLAGWLAAIGISVAVQWRWLTLHDDVRATLGALRAGAAGGRTPLDVFVHRPMGNRIFMSALDHLTFGPVGFRERLTLALAMVLAGIAGASLACSLRGRVGRVPATAAGLATFAALAWAPDTTLLQPEWTAALLCVPALALALGGGAARPDWRSPLMWGAGLLFAFAILQKYTTATSALLAWGVVLVLSRRRAWTVGCWTAGWTAVLFGLTILELHEWLWFTEMPRLQPGHGVRWVAFGSFTGRVFWANPILLLGPAASLYGFAVSSRRVWLFGPLLAALLTLAGVLVQGRYYPYHYAALPVLIATLTALAAAAWWQQTGRLPLAVVLVAGGWLPVAAWTGHHPYGWRNSHLSAAVTAAVVTSVVAALVAGWQVRRSRAAAPRLRPWTLVLGAAGLALLLSFPDWPHTPAAYNWLNTTRASELTRRAALVAEGQHTAAAAHGAPVAYLTLQEGPYFVGLPATCSYPLAVFLYRSVGAHGGDLVGFGEDLDCLRDPAAKFLVLQGHAADRAHALPLVRTTIEQEFRCPRPAAGSTYVLCPRR